MNKVRRACCGALLVLLAFSAKALPPQWAFRVSFTNKNGTANISTPINFLSQRALDRRNHMGIAVDSSDLPVSPAYIDSVLAITGGKLHVTSRWLNQCVVLLTDSSKILLLQGKPFIQSFRLVGTYVDGLHRNTSPHKVKNTQENNIYPVGALSRTTGSAAYYGYSYDQVSMVNGDYLHDHGYKGDGVLIAVLDAGFVNADLHTGFDSLRNSGRLLQTFDFVLDTSYVYANSVHGMAVLSTIAGNMPGTYVGTAPNAMYALYRTEDETGGIDREIEMDNLVAGAERADSIGADIITASVGYFDFTDPYFTYVTAQLDGKTTLAATAINTATKKGILCMTTAGNEGTGGLLTPGDADSALTHGSVDINRIPASTSSYGPNAAGRIKPDISGMGEPAYVLSGAASLYGIANGTSFVAPQMAGWAACLLQAAPYTLPYVIRNAIIQSADHYTNPGPQIGYGIPNFMNVAAALAVIDTTHLPLGDDFIALWPTVFTDQLRIKVTTASNQAVKCALTDAAGRLIWKNNIETQRGVHWYNISVPANLPSGFYFFTAVGADAKQTVKLVKN